MTLVLACLAVAPYAGVREPLHVVDGRLREENADVVLRGVEISVDETAEKTQFPYRSARVALEDWNANCVEISVKPRAWMGKTEGQKDKGRSIQDSVEETAALVTHRKGFAILSLAPGGDDKDAAFVQKDLATRFRASEHVLFRVASLDALAIVRKAGAKNVTIVDKTLESNPSEGRGFLQAGSSPDAHPQLLDLVSPAPPPNWADQNWIAHSFSPGSLLQDWQYATTDWGKIVRDALPKPAGPNATGT